MNPGAELARGLEAYEGFHWGRPSRRRRRVQVNEPGPVLVQLGKLEAVTYSTVKGRQRATWEHEFGDEGGRKPVLAMDARRRLHIVGGDYDVEDRGIVG